MRRVAMISRRSEEVEDAACIVTGPDSSEEPSIPERVIRNARQSFPGPEVRVVSQRPLSVGRPAEVGRSESNRFRHMAEVPSVGSIARMSTASAVPDGPQTTLKQSYIP